MAMFSKKSIWKTFYHFSSADANVDAGWGQMWMKVRMGQFFDLFLNLHIWGSNSCIFACYFFMVDI
jgi:hypothetical protein